MTTAPLGTLLTAMVTPMTPDGEIDRDGVAAVVEHLLATGHDGLVVNGTTGESATLTTEESIEVVRLVAEHVAGRAHVVAGAGSNDTAHAVHLAREMAAAGATGLLVVTPYYNKPPQRGLLQHFRTVADATDLPVCLYDIPGRAGVPIETETLIELSTHPRIVAVKDAKADLFAATKVMAASDLAWYSGDDVLVLPHVAQGAVGLIGVTTHLAGREYKALIEAALAGRRDEAIALNQRLAPIADAVMNTSQGAIMAKAGLVELGVIDHATVRLPLVEGTPEHLDRLRQGLVASGLAGTRS
jgi:4-hydroxy-tetrahydrodipicolinate synthase